MDTTKAHNDLLSEIEDLKAQLFEANSIIDAIKEGDVDALVFNQNGQSSLYALESADYTYRILIENFGEGALSLSDDGLILYCNEYFSNLVGIPANQIVGTYISSYLDYPLAFERIKKGLQHGPSKGELVLNVKDTKKHVLLSITDLNPNVSAFGVVVTDLTEKRIHEEALIRYQERLEHKVDELNRANESLEQFVHVISHDIKEPMRKIVMYTSHLAANSSELFSEKDLKNMVTINSSAMRLNSLVDDLVTYAFSANKSEVQPVSLDKVLREVLEDLEIVIKERNAEVTFTHLPIITASKVQMRQLFSNLISNAIKYGKSDVPVKIDITADIEEDSAGTPEGKRFIISISDNGIGMEKSHLNKIFTIFQRLHLRNEYSGNGIGLAICKKIMENHNGKITVDSTFGEGSTFELHFPITQDIDGLA